jgi:RNase P subunit RPR2
MSDHYKDRVYYCKDCRNKMFIEVTLLSASLNFWSPVRTAPKKTITCDNCGGEARYVKTI